MPQPEQRILKVRELLTKAVEEMNSLHREHGIRCEFSVNLADGIYRLIGFTALAPVDLEGKALQ